MKFKRVALTVASLMLLFTVGCGKYRRGDAPVGSPKAAYFNWIHAIEDSGGNPAGVVVLYANDAILFPTLSEKMCTSKKMIGKYFKTLLVLKDLQIETQQLVTREYGEVAMNTGYYTFSFMNGNKKEHLRARFDFWYKKVDGQWKIIYQHSSLVPVIKGRIKASN